MPEPQHLFDRRQNHQSQDDNEYLQTCFSILENLGPRAKAGFQGSVCKNLERFWSIRVSVLLRFQPLWLFFLTPETLEFSGWNWDFGGSIPPLLPQAALRLNYKIKKSGCQLPPGSSVLPLPASDRLWQANGGRSQPWRAGIADCGLWIELSAFVNLKKNLKSAIPHVQ